MPSSIENDEAKRLIAEARTNLAEKVSIAGLKEAFQEHILWIRRIYQLAIFLFACTIVYKTNQLIIDWLNSGYKNEINDVANLELLPMSNVTICVPVYFNETFVKQNVTIPENIIQDYTAKTGQTIDTLYAQLTLFLSFTFRPRKFSALTLKYFSKIIYENKQINDYSAFALAALPTCQSVLKKCWFDGKLFDCCQKAVQSIDNEGVCYLLSLNFDSDNAFPDNATIQQSKAGPKGGLTVEASIDVKDFSSMDDVIDDGFKIFVDHVPYSPMQSPATSPNGAETFVKVKAKKQSLTKNCASHGRLSTNGSMYYHDPRGSGCTVQKFLNLVQKYFNCHFAFYTYRPNSSVVCSPVSEYICVFGLSSPNIGNEITKIVGSQKYISDSQVITKFLSEIEANVRNTYSNAGTADCMRHCDYWEYSSASSFVYLEKSDYNNNVQTDQVMFSRIHVFYGDFEYRQYREVKQTTTYLVFCNFSNVVMLYLGMSIVSFFDLSFYLARYVYVRWRWRKKDKRAQRIKRVRIRRVKVHPITQ